MINASDWHTQCKFVIIPLVISAPTSPKCQSSALMAILSILRSVAVNSNRSVITSVKREPHISTRRDSIRYGNRSYMHTTFSCLCFWCITGAERRRYAASAKWHGQQSAATTQTAASAYRIAVSQLWEPQPAGGDPGQQHYCSAIIYCRLPVRFFSQHSSQRTSTGMYEALMILAAHPAGIEWLLHLPTSSWLLILPPKAELVNQNGAACYQQHRPACM